MAMLGMGWVRQVELSFYWNWNIAAHGLTSAFNGTLVIFYPGFLLTSYIICVEDMAVHESCGVVM